MAKLWAILLLGIVLMACLELVWRALPSWWLVRLAWDRDGRLAVNGPLKLSRDPCVITWYQHSVNVNEG